MSRPAVLLLCDSLRPGGSEGQFVEAVTGLDRTRWDVRAACLSTEGALGARLAAAGVAVRAVGRGSLWPHRLAPAVVALARRLRQDRIALVHCFELYSDVLGVLAARLARCRVIASQRELGDLRSARERRAYRLVLRAAHAVLVNSEAVAARLCAERVVPAGRIVVIPNGVDTARFHPAPGPAVGEPPAEAAIVVGALGVLRPEKGLGDLVAAAALVRERCPRARFVIHGDGACREDLRTLIAGLGLGDAVTLAGATDAPAAALRGLDVFALPSVSEASSNALLEAMATGLPVVATRVGGSALLVEDGVTGLLVPPRDPAALAKALVTLIEDRRLAARLGAAALDRVRAVHGLPAMLGRLEALYARTLGRDP
jgi:glycosyltransferase involved in cell wall biosynthesis